MLAEFNLQCLFQKCSNTFNRSFGWTCSRVVQCWLGCGSFQWNPKCTRALCFGGRTCSIHIGNCNTSSWSGNFIAQKTCSSSWASNITQWEAYVFGSALWTSLCSIHFPIYAPCRIFNWSTAVCLWYVTCCSGWSWASTIQNDRGWRFQYRIACRASRSFSWWVCMYVEATSRELWKQREWLDFLQLAWGEKNNWFHFARHEC